MILVLAAAMVALVLVPSTMSAGEEGADEAFELAAAHVSENAADLGVTAADVSDLVATSQYTSRHNGVTHVNLNQSYRGLEVFGGHVTVNVSADGEVLFASGTLVELREASGQAELDATEAVEAAAEELDLDEPSNLEVIGREDGAVVVSGGGISDDAIPAKLGWQPTADGLRLAWQLVIDDSSDIHLWNVAVDAETGELLDVEDWTIEDEHEDLAATVKGGKLPTPAESFPPARGFSLDPVADGSCYRVLDLALESPNDGDRRFVCNPADALASPFGWHDTDGAVGPEFTITRGNNAHAYLDQDSGQGGGTSNNPDFGFDVDGGPGLQFDFPADLNEHAQNYRDAVVTNLFFGCNAFHDVLYLYGWTEDAGNMQANNYGRGDGEGDYVRCEAADGGGTNNANFSTPSGVGTPRMQMYLWPGNQFGSQNQVVVAGGGEYGGGWARFSPAPSVAGTSGQLFDAGNGCAPGDYAGAPAGFVAIVAGNNTGCTNISKVREAEAAGAAAAIVAHTTGTTTPILTGPLSAASPAPNIPVISVNLATGDAIRGELPATATVRKHPNHPGIRDGDFENGIIWHEYGHGMSNRLTGGPGINCLGSGGNQQQAGEGWSDYVANVAMIDPELDDPQGPRGMGPYALFQDSRQGNGIRHRPYSRTMEIQPATYDSIKSGGWLNGASVSSPHGIGHVWAAILWDMTWDLIDKHGFSGNIYEPWDAGGNNRAMQYMVDGLKFQGCGPTFVVASRAIIESANVLGGGAAGENAGDACSIWASFSRRGLGYSAESPTGNRNAGAEAFDTHPDCREGFLAPVHLPYGELNVVEAGSAAPLRFTIPGATGLDVLMPTNSPFSRKVDCETLRVPSITEGTITPREYPEDASPSGKSGLSRSATGVYTYAWKTQEAWVGTCRELVLTRLDGTQHRAFFQFVEPS
ncbi:MAG TPA: M36 family metallopeptidase [Gaiellaceae bacterium]|nr:M36 family metallopeptidase [Gaiellaceae bacterium]